MKRYIKINRARVYLDEGSFANGLFRVEAETMSEQCEGCGVDIAETGTLDTDKEGSTVRCDEVAGGCETYYEVADSA